MPIDFSPLKDQFAGVTAQVAAQWNALKDREQRERAIQAQSTAALMNAQNGQDANMIRAQEVQNRNAVDQGALANAFQRTGIDQQATDQQGAYQQGMLANQARGQDMQMQQAQMEDATRRYGISSNAAVQREQNANQAQDIQNRFELGQGQLGLDQQKFGMVKDQYQRQVAKEESLKQAAQGGLPAIRDWYVSQGLGDKALELDKAQADIQEKLLMGKKTLYEITDKQEQRRAGEIAGDLAPRFQAVANLPDGPDKQKLMAELSAYSDAKYGTSFSQLTPDMQETAMAQYQIANNKAVQNIIPAGGPALAAFANYFAGLYTKPPESKGVNVNVQPVTIGPDGKPMSAPTQATQSELQQKVINTQNTIKQFDTIKQNFDKNLVGFWANQKANAYQTLDNLGLSNEARDKFIADREKLFVPVEIAFNNYRKLITGAAAGEKELRDLKKAFLNNEIGPQTFQARLDALMNLWKSDLESQQGGIREGIPIGGTTSPQGSTTPTNNEQRMKDPTPEEARAILRQMGVKGY